MVIKIEAYEYEMIIKIGSLNEEAINRIIKVLDKYNAEFDNSDKEILVTEPLYLIIKELSEFADILII